MILNHQSQLALAKCISTLQITRLLVDNPSTVGFFMWNVMNVVTHILQNRIFSNLESLMHNQLNLYLDKDISTHKPITWNLVLDMQIFANIISNAIVNE